MDNNGYYYNNNGGYGEYPPPPQPPKRSGGKTALIIVVCVLATIVVLLGTINIFAAVSGRQQIEQPASDSVSESAADPDDGKAEESADKHSGTELNSTSGIDFADLTPEEVAAKLIPSVVCIQNYVNNSQTLQGFGVYADHTSSQKEIVLAGEGSGIIVSEDGYIVTNCHVVNGADQLTVVLSDDSSYDATLIGLDEDTDLAVIKIEATGLTVAELGDSDELNVGEFVMAIGNPGGHELSSTVTMGIVSAKDRPLAMDNNGYTMNTIQTDAAINPGNSGGALVNLKGQVVGISSAKYVATGYEGLGFAITINEAIPIINDIMENGYVANRAMMGITYTFVDEATAKYNGVPVGIYVNEISNLQCGDLRPKDIITKVNDTEITDPSDLKNLLRKLSPGEVITLECYRMSTGNTFTTNMVLIAAQNTMR